MELEITRRNGTKYTVLYDDIDHSLVSQFTWRIHPRSANLHYAITHIKLPDGRRSTQHMHTMIAGPGVDHINHNGLDNRRTNLRPATPSLQGANRRPQVHSSRFKGVYRQGKVWRAEIQINNRSHPLGQFSSEEEAARTYDDAAREAWGDYAFLNFPRGH